MRVGEGGRRESEPALPDKISAIDGALTADRIDHAFGGALALAYYAEPRMTIDIDVNVFRPPEHHGAVADALLPLGVVPRDDTAALERDGQARWWWNRTPVDLFFSYDPVHEAMREGVRRVFFGEERIPILGPEHLMVCKAVYNRPKDWIDIEQMLLLGDDIDRSEVNDWIGRIAGAGDPRSVRLEELLGRDA
ncbi:MAG: nucleotidyl transferase AbiEii/AbiGii toxin family protein [Solirubrobacterales bacterium]|nr:nucleotidyl transferase AbiEii/AbiGii toxin family protein [Solirubrobacterales bacterium]